MHDHAIRDTDRVSELALSIAWHASLTREVITTDGERLAVIFPGHWTHGHGPDFRDAMLEGDGGKLLTGSIELHHRASDWVRHGHHTDPAYNEVVLHVVTEADTPETRRVDGALVPMAVLQIPATQLRAVEKRRPEIWDRFGGDVCADRLAREQPDRIRNLLRDLGDTRFDQRAIRFESELSLMPPSAALVPALFEAFGYSRNREQMLRLAAAVDWPSFAPRLHRLERDSRIHLTLAVLLGLGGWMPLSPSHASIARLAPSEVTCLETIWGVEHPSWEHAALPGAVWDVTRVRPANHPVARVATLAALLGGHATGLVPELLDAIRDKHPLEEVLQQLVAGTSAPSLGADRAIAIAASVVLPFAVAYARLNRDDTLEDDAFRAWVALPAGSPSQSARRARQQIAGDVRITGLRERGTQGLLWLDRHYCSPRRCYECPIARAVVADELRQPSSSMNTCSSSVCS